MNENEPKNTDPAAIADALQRRVNRRTRTKGEMSMPAAPALLPMYLKRFAIMFAAMGKRFATAEIEALSDILSARLERAWAVSPHGRLYISWESEPSPSTGIDYQVWHDSGTLAEQYAWWVAERAAPLFGKHPDARLMDVARALGDPKGKRVLDIGAGTGRNTLPLARLGFETEALELTPEFCEIITQTATSEELTVRVVEADAVGEGVDLGEERYDLIVCSEVTSHFRSPDDLRRLFERAARWLKPDGQLLVNLFVTVPGYEPNELARQLSQICWSTLFTPSDVARAAIGLPLDRLSDVAVHPYERANQPTEDWPPTGWYEDWSRGFDLFGIREGYPPIELRWQLYTKSVETL